MVIQILVESDEIPYMLEYSVAVKLELKRPRVSYTTVVFSDATLKIIHLIFTRALLNLFTGVTRGHRAAAGISTKLDRKQVPKVLSQVCSFRPDPPRGGSRAGQHRSQTSTILKNLLLQSHCMD